jgi:hypothetical protein
LGPAPAGGAGGWFSGAPRPPPAGPPLAGVTVAGRLASKLVPPDDERGATSRRELVGTAGTVASPALDARYGEVRVSDGRHEMIVHARVHGGDAALAHGDRVVLIELDDASGFYWVTALPDAAA